LESRVGRVAGKNNMAIPKYDEIMLPLLKKLSDGQPHTRRELAEKMADHFGLTPEEREQMLPSTRVTYIKHRTGWADLR
jgi:restriction system protein